MQVGDQATFTGMVRDMVGGSVLMAHDDGREYWFLEQHVQTVVEAVPPEPPPVEPIDVTTDPNYQAAVDHLTSKGYSVEQAQGVVAQLGVDAALKA